MMEHLPPHDRAPHSFQDTQFGMQVRRQSWNGLFARHVYVVLLFSVAILLLNTPQVTLLTRLGSTVWYPSMGLALALMLGISPWYGLLLYATGVLSDVLFFRHAATFWLDTVGDAGISLSYATAAYILRGYLKIDLALRRRRDVVCYIPLSLAAAAGSSIIGAACVAADHGLAWKDLPISAFNWFLSDAVAVLGVGPFFLLYVIPVLSRWISGKAESNRLSKISATAKLKTLIEAVAQIASFPLTLWLMFARPWSFLPHFYLSMIPCIWMAMRQGIRRAATGNLMLNFCLAAALRLFPADPGVHAQAAFFMLVASALGLFVGSEVTERERTAIDLHTKTNYLNALIQNCPLGIAVLNREGQIELANKAFEQLFLYDQKELTSLRMDPLLSKNELANPSEVISRVLAGQTRCRTEQRRRKDGKLVDVEIHAVPLMVDGRVQGAYEIFQDVSNRVKTQDAERKHAEELASLVQELQLRTREVTLLSEMRDWLESCTNEVEACSVLRYSCPKLFPEARSGAVYLFQSSRNVLECAIQWGEGGLCEQMFASEACWSLRRGQPHWNGKAATGLKCDHIPEKPDSVGSLCVPMLGDGKMMGLLHLEFRETGQSGQKHDEEDMRKGHQRLAISVTGNIAQSLSSLRLREALRQQSIRDPLTGLFNRRFLQEAVETELHRADRREEPLSILLIDLDHFKLFNDTFGHEAGDVVLRGVADLFRSFFRAGDICCRQGGEEFVIVLPGSSSKDAAVRATALRTETKRMSLQYRGQRLGTVTLSIGVATFPNHGSTVRELFDVADHCLYQSKANGRDTVTVGNSKLSPECNEAAVNSRSKDPA